MSTLLSKQFVSCQMHPIFYITALFACGIVAQSQSDLPISTLLFAIIICTSCALYKTLKNPSAWLMWALLFALISGALCYESQKANHELGTIINLNTPCTITGTITSITPLEHQRLKQCINLETKTIQQGTGTPDLIYTRKTIAFYTMKKTDAKVQDTIELKNVTLKTTSNNAYNDYLIKENIAATLFLPTLDYTLINRPIYSPSRWLFYYRESLLKQCKAKLSWTTRALFSSIFLGNKFCGKKQMEKSKDSCKAWGISHYLARSGLHMVIFIIVWHILLSLLLIPLFYRNLFLIFLSMLYYVLSWSSISFFRALIGFILFKTCALLKVPSQVFHLLTIVTLIVLVYNPMQLFFLDFQLSFGLTFALAWFNRIHSKKLHDN
ncbi:MAG: ComEC/Rec2 family competence protein [Candidatus Dependentiae bacterium]|nr:ComEC/Rec2 family competence protein [Candidatus Dependentiae bacterium]